MMTYDRIFTRDVGVSSATILFKCIFYLHFSFCSLISLEFLKNRILINITGILLKTYMLEDLILNFLLKI
jgi:hypothetical protein